MPEAGDEADALSAIDGKGGTAGERQRGVVRQADAVIQPGAEFGAGDGRGVAFVGEPEAAGPGFLKFF